MCHHGFLHCKSFLNLGSFQRSVCHAKLSAKVNGVAIVTLGIHVSCCAHLCRDSGPDFAGSALAQPQFDLAADLPNPLELAQDAKSKADSALPSTSNEGIPSNGNAAAQQDPVGDREALLAKMESTTGPDGTPFLPSHPYTLSASFV